MDPPDRGDSFSEGSDEESVGSSIPRIPITIENVDTEEILTFDYDEDKMHYSFIEFMIACDLPYTFLSDPLVEYHMQCLNPLFKSPPKDITKELIMKKFQEQREQVKELIKGVKGKFSLCFQIWDLTDYPDNYYLCIAAYFIDDEWKLNKRIISLSKSYYGPEDEWMIYFITEQFKNWGLAKRVFAITTNNLNNRINSTSSVLSSVELLNEGRLYHVPCYAHVLSSIMQVGFEFFDQSIEKIRQIIRDINDSKQPNPNLEIYRKACEKEGIGFSYFLNYAPWRWSCMYKMIDVALQQQRAIDLYCSEHPSQDLRYQDFLNEFRPNGEDWENLKFAKELLRVCDGPQECCSSVYHPKVCEVVHQLGEICLFFQAYSNVPRFEDVTRKMKEKFYEHWDELPVIFGLASILDPRTKTTMLKVLIELIYNNNIKNLDNFEAELNRLFEEYRANTPKNVVVGSSSSKAATTKIAEYLKMKQPEYVKSSELECYLNEPLIQRYDNDDFDDVLAWWKAQECRFPVLAAMARDVLTVHVSTVTPEEILSTGRRVLEKEKCSLGPTILEATVCLRGLVPGQGKVARSR